MGNGIVKGQHYWVSPTGIHPNTTDYFWESDGIFISKNAWHIAKKNVEHNTAVLFGDVNDVNFYGVQATQDDQNRVFGNTTLRHLPGVLSMRTKFVVDGLDVASESYFITEYDLHAKSSHLYTKGDRTTGSILLRILNRKSQSAILAGLAEYGIAVKQVKKNVLWWQDGAGGAANGSTNVFEFQLLGSAADPGPSSGQYSAGPCLIANHVDYNGKDKSNVADYVVNCSNSLNSLYNGNHPWLYVENTDPAGSWLSFILDPSRTSLVDGAWPTSWTDADALTLGNDQNFGTNGDHYTVVQKYPSGRVQYVIVEHLVNMPLMMFGQAVMIDVASPTDKPPSWHDYSNLSRFLTLDDSCATNQEVPANGTQTTPTVATDPKATWSESGCPQLAPNYMWEGKADPKCPVLKTSQDIVNTQAIWQKWYNFYNVKNDDSAGAQTWRQSHDFNHWTAAISASQAPNFTIPPEYLAIYDLLDAKDKAIFAKKYGITDASKLPLLCDYYCQESGVYFFFVTGWPSNWDPAPIPSVDTVYQASVNLNGALGELGLDLTDIAVILALEIPIAFLSWNIHPEVIVPVSAIGMLGGLIYWNTRNDTAAEFDAAKNTVESDIENLWSTTTSTVENANSDKAYIITAVAGLGITGVVMYASYRELGVASTELIATEAALGVIGTGIAEIVIAAGSGWDDVKKWFGGL
jgi:hypothetical protein